MRLALIALAVAGCNHDTGGPRDMAVQRDFPPPFCRDGADGGPPATFASVQRILSDNCAVPMCHDNSANSPDVMQDLTVGHAYAAMVKVTAHETCHDGGVPLTRVVPGDAGASFLYRKLVDDPPCEGLQMPQSEVGAFPLPACESEIIRKWIDDGAKP